MNKVKILFLIVCSLTLTACSNTLLKYSAEEFSKNERAVVFFDIKEDKLSVPFRIYSYEKEEMFDVEHKNSGLIFSSEDKDLVKRLMFVEPGTYFISYITLLEKGNMKRWLPGPSIDDNRLVKYGAFSVKAGEVISLGILNYNNPELVLEDNFVELKHQLADSDKSSLQAKLKRGKFYKRGSYVRKATKKGVEIIPIEVINEHRKSLTQEIARRLEKSSK